MSNLPPIQPSKQIPGDIQVSSENFSCKPIDWYLLNFIPRSANKNDRDPETIISCFNRTTGNKQLEVFAPTFVAANSDLRTGRRKLKPLLYHYVFVKGNILTVKRLCQLQKGFSFVVNRGNPERYAAISENEMATFRRIASFYSNRLPLFSVSDLNLEEGDKVEIIEGDFPGLRGYYFPRQRSSSGNIMLKVTQNMATVLYDIKASSVRILEFSKGSRRSFDLIDAILPVLFSAMRSYRSTGQTDEQERSRLSLFSLRMGAARTGSKKTDAKLAAILWAIYHLLGNVNAEEKARERYTELRTAITNPATLALAALLESVAANRSEMIEKGKEYLRRAKSSAANDMLRKEFEYYSNVKAGSGAN